MMPPPKLCMGPLLNLIAVAYQSTYVYFSDLSERIEQDVLVYNTADLVSAIGGSLGILLGISLLSLTSKGLNYFTDKESGKSRNL